MIFETNRLIIRQLSKEDSDLYFDMMGNPNVMNLVPRPVMSREESDKHLLCVLNSAPDMTNKKVWAIDSKIDNEFIGICAFLKNDDHEDEIGYRLREKFWEKGYGTEIARGLIDYGFHNMNMDLITADVITTNLGSMKILEKFLVLDKEFFNPNDNCTDRRYKVDKETWLKRF